MKKFLHLMGGLCVGRKRSASNCRRSALSYRLPAISKLIPKTYHLIPFLFLVFVSCGAVLAQEPVGHTAPAAQAELIIPEGGIVIGDTIPEAFWNVKLNVVNHPDGITEIKLSDFKDKLLVLDFWATYCSPCVKSVDHWNELHKYFSSKVEVLAIHQAAANERAFPLAQKKGWFLPIAINNDIDVLLSKLFFAQMRFGQVWIKGGKLIAIPKNSSISIELINKALANQSLDIEMDDYLTYLDQRNSSNDESLNLNQ